MKKNTKIIRLTENDLERMVRRIIKESDDYETSTPIKPITIHGKTYKFVEDLPIRELGIGSYVIQDGIVMVDGETPLQDWLTQDMDAEDYMSEDERKVIKTSQLVNQFYDLLEQDLGYSQEEVDEIFQEVGDEPEMIIEFLSDLLSAGHGQMIDKQIIDLMSKLAPMADAFRDDEDYMSSEEDLINATYDLMYDLGDEDVEILDLQDAANILDEELYEGNHGPIMDQRIEDLLSQIEAIIGYSDYDEGEDIEDHL